MSSLDDVIVKAHAQLTMQKTDGEDWTSRQLMSTAHTSPEFGRWQASFDRRPHFEVFDVSCLHGCGRYQPHPAPPTSYVERVRREWLLTNYASYHRRLKQLECWSEVAETTGRTMSALGVDATPCRRWSDDNDDRQSIFGDLTDQLSSG